MGASVPELSQGWSAAEDVRRALVIGLGHMGSLHRKVLRDFGFAVESVDPVVPATYRTLEQAGTGFDVVVIAVPIPQLFGTALSVVPFHAWTLIEKPMSRSIVEARRLAESLQRASCLVRVGYIERFNPKVLELRGWLEGKDVQTASFVRHNDRPSDDRRIDLLTHDVDLANYLGIPLERCTFDVQPSNSERLRVITVNGKAFNLMAHDTSPLHGLWHAFLTDSPDVATPWDAVEALETAYTLSAEETMFTQVAV